MLKLALTTMSLVSLAVCASVGSVHSLQGMSDAPNCVWLGTAPICSGDCTADYPYQLTVGTGGGSAGERCGIGHKVLCCTKPNAWEQCTWSGTAPFCEGECPKGKTQIATDDAGDGSTCVSGNKAYCCNPQNFDRAVDGHHQVEQLLNNHKSAGCA